MDRSLMLSACSLVLALGVALAGCTNGTQQEPGGEQGPRIMGVASNETRAGDEMWVVWVQGEETLEPDPGYVCDVAFDHGVRADEEQVVYENTSYGFDPAQVTFLIAFDHWERDSSCPITYHLHWQGNRTTVEMGAWGELTLAPGEDGSLLLDGGARVQPGQRAVYTYQTTEERGGEQVYVDGTFEVAHLGAWPTSGLVAS